MARTSIAAVRVILGDHIEIADQDLAVHIGVAGTLVDAELGSSGLGTSQLTEIEKYLAAHFAAMADLPPGVTEQTVDGDEEVFTKAEGLRATHFGQTAITLDSTGILSKSGAPPVSLMVM